MKPSCQRVPDDNMRHRVVLRLQRVACLVGDSRDTCPRPRHDWQVLDVSPELAHGPHRDAGPGRVMTCGQMVPGFTEMMAGDKLPVRKMAKSAESAKLRPD